MDCFLELGITRLVDLLAMSGVVWRTPQLIAEQVGQVGQWVAGGVLKLPCLRL